MPAYVAKAPASFRPPAVPLVLHNPDFNVWSESDRLTDDWSRLWTGKVQQMSGLARIDGKCWRFIGPEPAAAEPMQQQDVEAHPTNTRYVFEAGGVQLRVTFTDPLLPDSEELVSRPVTYVTLQARSFDGQPHQVDLYFDCSTQWAVNDDAEPVAWKRQSLDGLDVMRVGTRAQRILGKVGDQVREDWGYFYVASPHRRSDETAIVPASAARLAFTRDGHLATPDSNAMHALATVFHLGSVRQPSERHLLLAYDDVIAIDYMHHRCLPYWRLHEHDAAALLNVADHDYAKLIDKTRRFDQDLETDLRRTGGDEYEKLGALAFRQCLAAHKLVADPRGRPMFFPKEMSSNGCIDTVDVIYPSAPLLLLFNPRLLRAQMVPILDYAASPRWKFPFAPHDLGTYPLANGQVYGGRETSEKDQMPVEESGNMIILAAALARAEGSPALARQYWPLFEKWARYLAANGMDPANQLSTDDFAGHLAHNTNLSLKAIIALAAYAQLCEATGHGPQARHFNQVAHQMARRWIKMADDGDHYRLTFDGPGTWSQKYNLIWDGLLRLNLFPASVARKELDFYKTHLNEFGLPLDSRKDYTKLDWITWTASLATNRPDFERLIEGPYHFADASPSRVPLSDWYDTKTGKYLVFKGRSVVGGVFIRMLQNDTLWRQWLSRDSRRR
jgi:hypothetical protein